MPGDLKAAKKEGGKKGQDAAGMCDMGGVKFYTIAVETPEGDMALMDAVMEGMNQEVDPEGEERRGGAGHLGKMLLSAGTKQLAILCHVPKALQEEVPTFSLTEWVKAVVDSCGATITEEGEEVVKAVAEGDADKELFPIKMRDLAQQAGFNYIKSKGLIPDDDSDDYVLDPEAAGVEW